MPYCVLKTCNNNSKKKPDGVKFHRFSFRNAERKELWIEFVRQNHVDYTWLPNKNSHICSEHFKDTDKNFSTAGFISLKKCAVPTYNATTSGNVVIALPNKTTLKRKLSQENAARKKPSAKYKKLQQRENRLNPQEMAQPSAADIPPATNGVGQHFDSYYHYFCIAPTNEKLNVLKTIVDSQTEYRNDLVHFMAVVFLESHYKHRVKGYVMRQISRLPPSVQENFSNYLSFELKKLGQSITEDFTADTTSVSKMSLCLDFHTGTQSLWQASGVIVIFLKLTLQKGLVEFGKSGISPTLKNNINCHFHETLRLLLFLIQRYQSKGYEDPRVLDDATRDSLKKILTNDDVQMDTKSLVGIVLLRGLVLEIGEEEAIKSVFGERESWLAHFMTSDLEVLVVFSALAAKPMLRWTDIKINGVSAVVKVLQDIINIGERSSLDASITLSVARTIYKFSKYLGTFDSGCLTPDADNVDQVSGPIDQDVAENLTFHVQSIIDHSMDSVRYLAGDTMINIAIFYNKSKDFEKLNSILGNCSQSVKRSYFLMADKLLCELDDSPKELVFAIVNTCIASLFVQEVQAAATVCLEAIIADCNISDGKYLSSIVSSMMEYIENIAAQGNLDPPVLEIYDRVINKLLWKEGLDYMSPVAVFLDRLRDPENVTEPYLISTLILLRAASKLRITYDTPDAISGSVYFAFLKNSAVHVKDEYRLLSLSIAVESKKTTKLYNKWEFSVIFYYIAYNINTQSPNFRQLTMSLLKKMFQRLQDSYNIILNNNLAERDVYAYFIVKLRTFCFECLSPGYNTSRRSSALQIISMIEKTILPSAGVFTMKNVGQLLECLEDGFETNKELALEALLTAPADLIKGNTASASLILTDILREASSVKPAACASAAYKLILIEEKFTDYINLEGFTKDTNILSVLIARLREECAVAQRNIAVASAQGPMYGLVHCIRKIIKKFDKYKSKKMVTEIISTCMEVNQVVAPIVNNSSPEGNLPEDLVGLSIGFDSEACTILDLIGDGGVMLHGGQNVTAQMVLLCGWRTVKEVSLLFGEICTYRSMDNMPLSLLTPTQIMALGESFKSLLSETKHRGAFEQAYVGFSQLLTRLWSSDDPELHVLPVKWLDAVMEDIITEDNLLCSTRRSAGLPFIIQALVTTELQVNSAGTCFQACMKLLLKRATCYNRISDAYKYMCSVLELIHKYELWENTDGDKLSFKESLHIDSKSSSSDSTSVNSVVENLNFEKATDAVKSKTENGQQETEYGKEETEIGKEETENDNIEAENAKAQTEKALKYTENVNKNTENGIKETEIGECSSVNLINETEKIINEEVTEGDISLQQLFDTWPTWDGDMPMLDTMVTGNGETLTEMLDTMVTDTMVTGNGKTSTEMLDTMVTGNGETSMEMLDTMVTGNGETSTEMLDTMVTGNGETSTEMLDTMDTGNGETSTEMLDTIVTGNGETSTEMLDTVVTGEEDASMYFAYTMAKEEEDALIEMVNTMVTEEENASKEMLDTTLTGNETTKPCRNATFTIGDENISQLVGTRTHSLNILRALYRNTNLSEAASNCVQEGLMVAIAGLDAFNWQERNSATLLLNALIVRVFGVLRNKDANNLSVRNKLTARVFFVRYPAMYDYMMDVVRYAELKEKDGELCHSLFGVLLILTRLYQSSHEGTISNFKLSAFVRPVMNCGSNSVLQTRRVAAKALASITPPHLWHGQVMATISRAIEVQSISNHLHGTVLQLVQLLGNIPESVSAESELQLAESLRKVFVIFFTGRPDDANNYVIRSELLKALNHFTLRFKSTVLNRNEMNLLLRDLTAEHKMVPSYNICVRDIFYFSIILRLKDLECGRSNTFSFPYTKDGLKLAMNTRRFDFLKETPYELLKAEMNVILIAYGKLGEEKMCEFQEHIKDLLNTPALLSAVRSYIEVNRNVLDRCLSTIYMHHYNMECGDKALMLLNAFGDTSRLVVEAISGRTVTAPDEVVRILLNAIVISREGLICLLKESLFNFLSIEYLGLSSYMVIQTLRLACRSGTSDNREKTRVVVSRFIENNFLKLVNMSTLFFSKAQNFEIKAVLWGLLMVLLEDDCQSIRESASRVVAILGGIPRPQLSTAAGVMLRKHVATLVCDSQERFALMLLLSLFDFRSEVHMQDQNNDAYRVFDNSEKHNMFLEEVTWTQDLATHILSSYGRQKREDIKIFLANPVFKHSFEYHCGKNLILFKRLMESASTHWDPNDYWNPKVINFVRLLM